MKNIVLLCLLALSLKSQITGTVVLTEVTPNVCVGQKFTIKFKYIGTHEPNNYFGFTCYSSTMIGYQLLFCQASDFYNMSKVFNGTDTIYSFKAMASFTIPPAAYIVAVSPDGNYPGKNLNISICTGIEEYGSSYNQKVIYYDLQGNVIEPRKNEWIIIRIGNNKPKSILIQ